MSIYTDYYHPEKMEILLQQKDLQGRSVLESLARLKVYKFLQINYVNQIISSLWESKTDIGGSIFDLATSFDLCCRNRVRNKEDREVRRRFYLPRDLAHAKPHRCGFAVWMHSASLRYLIEAFIFFSMMVFFQITIANFNRDMMEAMMDINEFRAMKTSIMARGGIPFGEPGNSRRDLDELD